MNFAEYITNAAQSGGMPGCKSYFIQPKLSISNTGDRYEKQADEVADKMMRMSPAQTGQDSNLLNNEKAVQGKLLKNNVENSGEGGKPLPNKNAVFMNPNLVMI